MTGRADGGRRLSNVETALTRQRDRPRPCQSADDGLDQSAALESHRDAERRLRELEQWARGVEAEQALRFEVEHPAAAMYALGVVQKVRLDQQQRALEAWALAQLPPEPEDPTRRPDRISKAEQAHRAALAHAMFSPQTRCGVCWSCQAGGGCIHYG